MNRSSHSLIVALAAGLFPFLVFWDGFPMLPVLDGCITAASALLGHHCLVLQRLPATQAARAVPEDVRRRWCRVLGILFLTNAALAPLGFLLWNILRFDQDLILLAQILGFFLLCLTSLIPVRQAAGKRSNSQSQYPLDKSVR